MSGSALEGISPFGRRCAAAAFPIAQSQRDDQLVS